ncbi:MAG: hypothetical protein AABW92_02390 [Nanoarchaeota archaeon]
MKKRGQIAVEYIMIVAISLFIILPGIYLFRNFAFASNDNVLQSRLSEAADSILSIGKEMYYYGPPSKSVKSLDMPSQISNMYILSTSDGKEYYLAFNFFTSSGSDTVLFESDYPIKPVETVTCNFACQGICECFPERYFTPGPKNFAVEASKTCVGSSFCVLIKEISPELN